LLFPGIVIQSEVHDSTEDARTALLLFRKYEELKSTGKLEKALEELYEAGKRAQWKVPSEPAGGGK
jgi:PAB-dependent poly(A)-specific ribonuclease subunit 2